MWVAGQGLSIAGNQMEFTALAWLVFQLTDDAFALGLLAAAGFGPQLVFGLLGPPVTDPLPKRRTLVITRGVTVATSMALWLLTLTGKIELWQVMALAATFGTAAVFDSSARQAFYGEMVDREALPSLVGVNWSLATIGQSLAPALSGVLIESYGVELPFLINALTSVIFIVFLMLMRKDEFRPVPATARSKNMRDAASFLATGLRYVWRIPVIRVAILLVFVAKALGMSFNVVIPPFVQDVLQLDASAFGFLVSSAGVGSTVVALTIAFQGRARTRPMVWGAILLGGSLGALAISASFPASLLAMVFIGAGSIAVVGVANAIIQVRVPDELRARAMSVYTTTLAGAAPIGGLIMGSLVSKFNAPAALTFAGLTSTVCGIGSFLWLRKRSALGEASVDTTVGQVE